MEPGLTARTSRPVAGFSLIELLIVVAVLSALAVGASLSGFSAGRARLTDPEALTRAVAQARQAALLHREPRALILGAEALTAAEAGPQGWKLKHEIARWRTPPVPAGDAQELPLTLVFLPDGRATPFTVTFHDGHDRTLCRSDGWEAPRCAVR